MPDGTATMNEGKLQALVITFFPMFIATLSLVTSIYNGYLNNSCKGMRSAKE